MVVGGVERRGTEKVRDLLILTTRRECWCAQSLSSMSEKFPDSACNLPCEGNTTQACGGSLKLTVSTPRMLCDQYPAKQDQVYMAGAAAIRITWAAGLVAIGAISLIMI